MVRLVIRKGKTGTCKLSEVVSAFLMTWCVLFFSSEFWEGVLEDLGGDYTGWLIMWSGRMDEPGASQSISISDLKVP